MLKLFHLFKNYYFGISFIGIVAFLIQEIPYIIMPLINPASNPVMNMQNEIKWIETVQGIFGMLSMIFLMLIVRDDVSFFSISEIHEKIFFNLTVLMIVINFVGWTFYYLGYQYGCTIPGALENLSQKLLHELKKDFGDVDCFDWNDLVSVLC